MKPIFEKERVFIFEKTGIDLPKDCWRNGSKIYLDIYKKDPIITFKAENGNISIKKNLIDSVNIYEQISLYNTIERERERVELLEKDSIKRIKEEFSKEKYAGVTKILAYSGGKDSDVLLDLCKKAEIDFVINFANTTNDTHDTYRHVLKNIKKQKNWNIMNPEKGWLHWLKEDKNYYVPNVLVRSCCSKYKEGQVTKHYNKKEPVCQILGVRALESAKRADYQFIMDDDFYMNKFGHNSLPKKWWVVAPIIDFSDVDVWIYLLKNNIEFNKMYEYGYNRCGCLICPYASEYTDILTEKYYPKAWSRWKEDILTHSYQTCHVKTNQKFTLQEWLDGKWKVGTSKIQEITSKKPTKENVNEVMELLGIENEDVARQYFYKKCSCCGKKIDPTATAMNLKYFGRNMNISKAKCKSCLKEEFGWTNKEYMNKVYNFIDTGCNLF